MSGQKKSAEPTLIPRKPTVKPTQGAQPSRISLRELKQLLGLRSDTSVKRAREKGEEYFQQWTRDKCGVAYRAVNVASDQSSYEIWEYEPVD